MPWNLDTKELEAWKVKAKEEQNYFGNLLGKTVWHKIDKNSSGQLQQKICFGLYGLPKSELCTEDSYNGYNQLQLSHTRKVMELIVQKHEQCTSKYVHMSFIFISVKCEKSENIVPLIRIPRFRKGSIFSHLFIDADLRLYKDWRDYMKHNKLPKCVMCYPCNGIYMFEQATVLVDFSESPACSILNNVVTGCDIANMVASLGTAGMLVTSAFLPLGVPVSIGSAVAVLLTGAYSTGRNISTLVDRGQHGQSIGLDNAESRNSWLGIAGSTLGIASGGMVATNSRTILAGESLGTASQIGLRSIAIGSCTVGALSITNGIANIMQKHAIKKEDILHLCSSVLFFTNAVITTYQANLLINSLRQSESSNSFSSILAKISEFTGGNSLTIDNQTLISIIQQTSNSAFLSLGLIGPNCALFIDMCVFAFDRLFTVTLHYWKGAISFLDYILHLTNTLQQLWERFEQEITEVINATLEYFNVTSLRHVKINGRQIFHNDVDKQQERNVGMILSSSVVDYKNKISGSVNAGNNDEHDVDKAAMDYVQKNAKIIETIAECSNCENSLQFNQCTKIVTEFIEHELDERIRNYEETYNIAVKFSGFIDRNVFDKAYGIQGNRVAWFSKQIFSEFDSSGTGYRLLNHLCQIQRVSDIQMLDSPEMKKLLGRCGGGSFYVFTSTGEVSHDKLISAVERVEDWSISRDSLEISSDGSITVISCKNVCNKELGTIILKNVNKNNGFVAVIPCQE
ncbi:hypothetical protein PR048_002740 [Dryococelus australis]|uniref:DUF4781 domain-containing protein n=1 Tax=Dryococelus australis TaxID=614101 RepID=A0ABQ9IL36_9NEOP|nr:hypothetical protein PR048_002740 [Dryococelus australis]